MNCKIKLVGKTRGRKKLYFCETHSYYFNENSFCIGSLADENTKRLKEIEIDLEDYKAIGIWGYLPSVFDNFDKDNLLFGVHLHARKEENGKKLIDETFKRVRLYKKGKLIIEIDALTATFYTFSLLAGIKTEIVICKHCKKLHTDKGILSLIPHRKHLCSFCKKSFLDNKFSVGNELNILKKLLPEYYKNRKIKNSKKSIKLNENKKFKIWPSNEAILWTLKREEERGIHVHVYEDNKKVIDNTFGEVLFENKKIGYESLRILTAQLFYSKIEKDITRYLKDLTCPFCNNKILYKGLEAFIPKKKRRCSYCKKEFFTKKAIIPNPNAWLLSLN